MHERLKTGGAAVHRAAVPPRALWVAAALAATAISAACNLLDDDQEYPSVARVEITGTAPGPLELVVSDDFQRVADFDQGARYTVLVRADTSQVELDFVKEYDIEAARRFYVRLTNHAVEVAQVRLTVAFDGVVGYSQGANLSESGALEFSEIFFGT